MTLIISSKNYETILAQILATELWYKYNKQCKQFFSSKENGDLLLGPIFFENPDIYIPHENSYADKNQSMDWIHGKVKFYFSKFTRKLNLWVDYKLENNNLFFSIKHIDLNYSKFDSASSPLCVNNDYVFLEIPTEKIE